MCKYKAKHVRNCQLAKRLSDKWSSDAHTGVKKMTAKRTPDDSTNKVNIVPSAPLIIPAKNNLQTDDVRNIFPRLELSSLSSVQ